MGVPPNGWFMREDPIYKWMIEGDPYFRKPLYIWSADSICWLDLPEICQGDEIWENGGQYYQTW